MAIIDLETSNSAAAVLRGRRPVTPRTVRCWSVSLPAAWPWQVPLGSATEDACRVAGLEVARLANLFVELGVHVPERLSCDWSRLTKPAQAAR